MKNIYLLLLFMATFGYAQQQPFITTWESTSSIYFYAYGENLLFDFGDGTVTTFEGNLINHTFATSGLHTVTIYGNLHSIEITNNSLKSIDQWGDSEWVSMHQAFEGCSNMTINAADVPNLSQVTDLSRMFYGCSTLNSNINNWDVSSVTNMSDTFNGCHEFNQPLNSWNVSNVTNMNNIFHGCYAFNQPINNWNVSSVTNMANMFYKCHAFNQPLDNWNVSNVANMDSIFKECGNFNQPLNNWDVSNVTDMSGMFEHAHSFNQPLNNWNVSNVTNMTEMFSYCVVFNQLLDNWNVSNVTNMTEMFGNCHAFNQPLNNWDVSDVTTMEDMFWGTLSFNQPLNNWDISNVTNIYGMFDATESFNQDLSAWDFSGIQSYISFNGSGLDTSNYDALLNRFINLGLENLNLYSYPVHYCDIGAHNYLIDNLGWNISDGGLGEDCQGNNVTGTMLVDTNLNGCETTDAPAVNFMVKASNGTYNYGTFVNATGNYDLRVQEDTYTVSPVNVPDYFTVTPESSEITFTGFGNSEALNFCLVPNQSVQDVNVTVLPIGDARPGFESDYKILVENIGTQSVTNAIVSLSFDNTLQSFVSATPAPATTSANQMTFNVGNLGVFGTKEIDFTMTTFQPPVVNGGEVAVFTANVTPDAGDNTPLDNTFVLNQTIVNSYDPNDKRVVQGDEIYMEQTGDYLDYIIRFQNTGTASAITVRVEDTLSHNLDWATLKPIAASHAYRVEVTQGNKVNFIFDNINLPHEAADAEGSNGYIAYKVKPKQGIQLGDVIAGNAGIYFDFNLPIITNTVTTTVVEPLGVKQNAKTAVSIYPNPAGDVVHLQAQAGTQVQQVNIYNLQGSELMSVSQNTETLDISSLGAGVYLLQVQTNTGRATCRLVKK